MTNTPLSVSARTLVSFLGNLTDLFPGPGDPEPTGPWGPIIRQAWDDLRYGPHPEPWRWGAPDLTSLAPRAVSSLALARAFVAQLAELQALAGALPDDLQSGVQRHIGSLISRFADDCGNGVIIIHPPKHGPWPPGDGEPKPIGPKEQVMIGAHLVAAGGVHPDLEAAGARLMERGLGQLAQG
jgi:hypothetical protein